MSNSIQKFSVRHVTCRLIHVWSRHQQICLRLALDKSVRWSLTLTKKTSKLVTIKNSATEHFVWPVRSLGRVYQCTFVPQLHYQLFKKCSRHIFSHVPTPLTNCFAANIVWPLVVTLAMLLLLINCRFIIISLLTNFSRQLSAHSCKFGKSTGR